MASHAPPRPPAKAPPSWWWFLGPVLLMIAAVIVGAGAFVSLLHTADHRYGEVAADGEPHAVSLPTTHRAMLMVPTLGNKDDWTCRLTDAEGGPVPTSTGGGTVSFSSESAGWQSLLMFDPADVGSGTTVTVHVACRTSDVDVEGNGGTVLLVRAPEVGALVVRIGLMVGGPLVLGGAAFVWLIALVVLQVVRRSGA